MGQIITLSSQGYKNYVRVKRIIESCVTVGQLITAINYCSQASKVNFIKPHQFDKLNAKLNDKLKSLKN